MFDRHEGEVHERDERRGDEEMFVALPRYELRGVSTRGSSLDVLGVAGFLYLHVEPEGTCRQRMDWTAASLRALAQLP